MATKISIPVALERRLRGAEDATDALEILQELIAILDDTQREVQTKRAATTDEESTGLGYRDLVALFRSYLGDSLATPPKPSPTYIVRLVNKTKEIGLTKEHVGQIAKGAQARYRPPYDIGFLVYRATEHMADLGGFGGSAQDSQSSGLHLGGPAGSTYQRVFTGRAGEDGGPDEE